MHTDAFGVWSTVSRNDPLARCELSRKTRRASELGCCRPVRRATDSPEMGKNENGDMDGVFLIMVLGESSDISDICSELQPFESI